MKKLILITYEIKPKEKYLADLRSLFGNSIQIEGYSLVEGLPGKIKGDLAIISTTILTNNVKKYLDDKMKIIYLTRTFRKHSLDKLFELPKGTKAMLVNNCSMTAIETTSLLYELGITHIKFTPVYPGMKNIPDLDLAVTPGQFYHVPERALEVIDLGWRVIDLQTLYNIMTQLEIKDQAIEDKVQFYAQSILTINYGLEKSLKIRSQTEQKLNVILNQIDDGIILMGNNNNIIHFNKALEKILDMDKVNFVSLNVRLKECLPPQVYQDIMEVDSFENTFSKCKIINKSLLISKRSIDIDEFSHNGESVIIIKDITKLEILETQVRKELVEKGYIAKFNFAHIVGKSPLFLKCIQQGKKISRTDMPVLITGESGTGKELFAQSIHNESDRRNNPFIAINCAALPSHLLESELFGYEEGAFTGAKKGGKKGLFELAHTGTIFLDEIGDLPLNVQVKLLRVLQEKEVMRIGGTSILPVDVRIISATNRDLKELLRGGIFRKDLYYRLNVFSIYLPPLRERKDDIPLLIENIMEQLGSKKKMDDNLLNAMYNYPWEGNIRELKNCMEYLVFMGEDILTIEDLPADFRNAKEPAPLFPEKNNDFPQLFPHENRIAWLILETLRYRNAGRRAILKGLQGKGLETSEHEVRKIMEFLSRQGLISFGTGRSGAYLTSDGKDFLNGIVVG